MFCGTSGLNGRYKLQPGLGLEDPNRKAWFVLMTLIILMFMSMDPDGLY